MLHLRLDDKLLKALDDFRFRFRFEGRSPAIRWLLSKGLELKLAPKQKASAK
jgi:metal-responsive CopG/Arc/MetJ family transcriptional regulator